MSTAETRALTQRLTAARLAGDVEAISALLAHDVVHRLAESIGLAPAHGRDDVAVRLTTGAPLDAALHVAGVEREVVLTIADGEHSLVQVRFVGTTLDGVRHENEYIWIYRWRDGQVCEVEEFTDALRAADAGVIKEVPAWP